METLYLSLKQHNVCVLKVSEIMAKGNQKLMDKACADVLSGSPGGASASRTPVITRSPGKATCSLRLGAAQLQHYPESVTKLAPVVSTPQLQFVPFCGHAKSRTPVITRSPGKATCSLRLGAAQLQHYPESVTKLAPVVRTPQCLCEHSDMRDQACVPVITRSPGKAICSLRLGAAQLQHYPGSVTKLAPVVSTPQYF